MAELDIDISSQRAKSLSEFDDAAFEYVVTLCADAAENCPIFPGGVNYLHHTFNDPVSATGSENKCAPFAHVRDQIWE